MLGWFQALMPKEDRFFDLFERHAQICVAGAKSLQDLLRGGDAISRHCGDVLRHEQEADAVTRDVLVALRRSFITPFDRSDIGGLIMAMDDAIDEMQRTAKAVTLFKVSRFDPPVGEIAEAIVQSASLVAEAMPRLRSMAAESNRLNAVAEKITAIEGQVDELYDTGLKRLFEASGGQHGPMDFVIGKEILDRLEAVVDRFDDVGNKISGIVIEQA